VTDRDLRRPSEVTQDFRLALAERLAPHGFIPQAKGANCVRRRGKITDRVELSSSHLNAPGDVTCFVALAVHDAEIRRRMQKWQAGGVLSGPHFAEAVPRNIADPAQAQQLLERVERGLEFFELVNDAPTLERELWRRYVPGFAEPDVIVPYLFVRLGQDAAARYADALLSGRPELWPSFASERAGMPRTGTAQPDHGMKLATALRAHAIIFDSPAPEGSVLSLHSGAANLRCFFGRQLRAWGETDAARALLRVTDETLLATRSAQEALKRPLTTDPEAVQLVLRAVTGEVRPLCRERPTPIHFQYHVLHEPFADAHP
jgi:hypothetical protein